LPSLPLSPIIETAEGLPDESDAPDMLRPKSHGWRFLILFIILFGVGDSLPLLSHGPFFGQSQSGKKTEPPSEYSRQWLEEVVPYIITAEEKKMFLQLPNEVERGKFIENFWRKRDPNPQTAENEFKIGYYKRIALANKLFGQAGFEGWRTDRGRVFILLGPPHEIRRDLNPTRSSLTTFQGPSETWDYWNLQNPRLPYNMEFFFIDKFGTSNYVLEKGINLESGMGSPLDLSSLRFYFDDMENIAEAMRNPFENLDKLRGIVTTQVSYSSIPLRPEIFFFKGLGKAVHVPLVVEIPYSALTRKNIEDTYYYSLTLLLNIKNSAGQVLFEKSKDLNSKHSLAEWNSLKDESFQLQTSLSLSLEPETYKLQLLAVDNYSGKVGLAQQVIRLPDFNTTELCLSDFLLSPQTNEERKSEPQEASQPPERPFREIRRAFRPGEELNIYFEVYNLTFPEGKEFNDLNVEYSFLKDGKSLVRVPRKKMNPSNEKDCRVQTSFRLKNFEPGSYTLEVKIIDGYSGQSLTKGIEFIVIR
jgi:GWxTD domain-containing protein